jgi:hypothetical protein
MNADGLTKVGSDRADDVVRVEDTFNRYVNPEVCQEYWDQRTISMHGILLDDDRIMNAGNMRKWDKVMVCLSRGAYEANVRVILLRLHEHKMIMFLITMPLTKTIGIVQTT